MLKIKTPDFVADAILCLEAKGFEAYVVGGAIRDSLLGITPFDWDIATNALPEEIMSVFPKHYATGLKHGTITAIIGKYPIEITTYRIDGKYLDSRRPENVEYTKRLFEDLKRRDFSINALAYNERSGIIDAYGGVEDLRNGIIRCVGNPNDRFTEDALRILRAIRFAAAINFQIEPSTFESIGRYAHLLKKISGERICAELTKLIMCDSRIELLFDSGVGDVVLPEVSCCFSIWQNNPQQLYDVGNHLLETVINSPKNPILRFAALLHDIGKAKTRHTDFFGFDTFPNHAAASVTLAKHVLERLKFSNKAKKAVLDLIKRHEVKIHPATLSVKRAAAKLGKAELDDLIALKRANSLSHSEKYMKLECNLLDKVETIYNEIINSNTPLYIKDLAIDGNDVKKLGFVGSEIGNTLRFLMVRVIENETLNTKDALIELAIKRLKNRTRQ